MEALASRDSKMGNEVYHLAYLTTTGRTERHKNKWCAEVSRLKGILASLEAMPSSKGSREWHEATLFST